MEIGYGRILNSSLPVLLRTDFSIPMGKSFADDFKYRLGGEFSFLQIKNFSAFAKIMANFRRYNSELVGIVSFGTELSFTAGYYKTGWHIAGELGFDKSITSNFNPHYALKNLFRIEATSKQGVSLTCFNSP